MSLPNIHIQSLKWMKIVIIKEDINEMGKTQLEDCIGYFSSNPTNIDNFGEYCLNLPNFMGCTEWVFGV